MLYSLTPGFQNGIKNLLPTDIKALQKHSYPLLFRGGTEWSLCPEANVKQSCIPKSGLNTLLPYWGPFFKRRRNSKCGCCGSRCGALPWESNVCSRLSHLYDFPHFTTLLFGRGHGERLAWRQETYRGLPGSSKHSAAPSLVPDELLMADSRVVHLTWAQLPLDLKNKVTWNYPGAKINDCRNTRGLSNLLRTCCFL